MRTYLLVSVLALGLTAACGDAPADAKADDSAGDDVPTTTPYLLDAPPVDHTPALDVAGVEGVMDGAVAGLGVERFAALYELTDAFLTHGGGTWPTMQEYTDGGLHTRYLVGEDTSTDGTTFVGALRVVDGVDADGNDLHIVSSEGFSATLTTTDGAFLDFAMYAQTTRKQNEDTSIVGSAYFSGTARADAATADGNPWLTGTRRAEIGAYTYIVGAFSFLAATGSIADDGDAAAIAFRDFAVLTAPCGEEPAGALSIRDQNGAWHDVVFAARGDDGVLLNEAECDGCGGYLVDGNDNGEPACISAASLLPYQPLADVPW